MRDNIKNKIDKNSLTFVNRSHIDIRMESDMDIQNQVQEEITSDSEIEVLQNTRHVIQEHTGDSTEEETEGDEVDDSNEESMTATDSQVSDSENLSYRVKPMEFKAQISSLKLQFKSLVALIDKLYSLNDGETYRFPDNDSEGNPIVLEHDDLTLIKKAYLSRLSELNKYFVHSLKGKGKKGTKDVKVKNLKKGSLNTPMFAGGSMVMFFLKANLGNAYIRDPNSPNSWIDTETPLQDLLKLFFTYGLINRSGLTSLLILYYRLNGLQHIVNNKKVITADDAMYEAFGDVFATMTATPTEKSVKVFNPESFVYLDNSRIIKYCTLDIDDVSFESKAFFDSIHKDLKKRNSYKNPSERDSFIGGVEYQQFFEELQILNDTFEKVKYDNQVLVQ